MKRKTWMVVRGIGSVVIAVAIGASGIGCGSTVTRVQSTEAPRLKARWVLLPFVNHSETPQAGERVEALLSTVLRGHGLTAIEGYPAPKEEEGKLAPTDAQKLEGALAWAKTQKFDYVVSGSVEEWRYKSGLEAEPAVGVSIQITELASNRVLWSASGTKTGSSAENASGTALKLLDTLADELHVAR